MNSIIIVGSGASGVNFALSVLKKGYDVTMLDVGFKKPEILNQDDDITKLKSKLKDPVKYFLGNEYEAFIPPDHEGEYYGFPPSKNYVFLKPKQFDTISYGFSPLFSFAQGGLAEVWTGGSYPLNDSELSDFPFSYNELMPYYNEVAKRIGISGAKDDLELFYPFQDSLMPSPPLDQHSSLLFERYKENKTLFNKKFQLFMGRSRVATLSQDKDERKACRCSGRCLWGCPGEALYTPSISLKKCLEYRKFHYIPGIYVTHFEFNDRNRITRIIAESLQGGDRHVFDVQWLVLAAGTLSSSKIFIESLYRKSGKIIKLKGLMDNRQVLLPFVNLSRVGKPVDFKNYQYHQLAIGIKMEEPKKYVHGQITTLKSALIHPIINSIPFDLNTAIFIFRYFHSALGLINLNFHDNRRDDNYLTLGIDNNYSHPKLIIKYTPASDEASYLKKTIKKVKNAFLRLGCVFPPGMTHIRPMGASVHYCGTIPMSNDSQPYGASENCQSNDFDNLYFVDGTTLPFLPAKNLTFTLMANAIRVAEKVF